MASNCKVIRAEIEESGGGAWLSRAAAEHLESCAGCLDFMNERDALRRLVGGLGRVEAPSDFEFRLRARMAAAKEKRAARFAVFRLAPGLASLALAAVFVTSIAASYYFNRPAITVTTDDQAASHQSTDGEQRAAQQPSPVITKTVNEVFKEGDKLASPSSPLIVEKAAVVSPSRRKRAATRAVTESLVEVAKAPTEGTLEFGLSTSPVVKASNVKLKVSSEPLRVVMRDEHGTPRRLSMRPVSFGAQNPVGKRRKPTARPTPTTVADSSGVW